MVVRDGIGQHYTFAEEIRAVISLTVMHGTPCSLVDSLETFDSTTGATHVYLVGTVLNQNPFPMSGGDQSGR